MPARCVSGRQHSRGLVSCMPNAKPQPYDCPVVTVWPEYRVVPCVLVMLMPLGAVLAQLEEVV